MTALFIKDPAVEALAKRVARRLGTSKTDAVRRGLLVLEQELPADLSTEEQTLERLRAWQRKNPLGIATGQEADKIFYDSLYE